jgi:DNA-binding YbaB/EbfC family protein
MAEGDSSPTGGLGDLFSQLQAAQADLESQAAAIDATVVEGRAAGGAVVVRLTGSLQAESVRIDPSSIDPADPALLEDAVLAALRDALGRIVELRSSLQAQIEPPLGRETDFGALVGNLDLEGLLGGVDINALMRNLGMGLDPGEFGSGAALGGQDVLDDYYDDDDEDDDYEIEDEDDEDDDDEDDDERTEEADDDVVDDEPQV